MDYEQPDKPYELMIEQDRAEEEQARKVEFEKDRAIARKLADKEAEREVASEEAKLRQMRSITASTLTPRSPKWLWAPGEDGFGRIPLGKLTLLVGKGGVGKTTLECQFASWITNGDMEGHYYGTPKDVLWVVYEDDLEDTVLPRLRSAGADLERVHFITMEMLGAQDRVLLPTDCDSIEAIAKAKGAVCLLVDPISAALRVDNGNDAKKVRAAAEAIQAMCMRSGLSCVGVAHTRKAVSHSLMDAIMGSSELGNVCRAAIGLIADHNEPGTVVLSQEKNNGGRLDIYGYRYRIVGDEFATTTELIKSSKMEFLGKVDPQMVSEILKEQATTAPVGKSTQEDCNQFVGDYIRSEGGEATRAAVLKAAGSEGFSRTAIDRAKIALKLVSAPSGKGAARVWRIPPV